ncbi:unnamed protein product [Rotaria sp. Silwood2]|nr:unnamed protein product [Rotaria sp. Silwood2]CAF4596299.1 unnamed protein product [Rotaria sp. Silwood2]
MAMSKAEAHFNNRIFRLTDIAKERLKFLTPIRGYEHKPLLSLEQAVEPLTSILPAIQNYANLAKQKCSEPVDGLTQDESAAIMLYSMGWKPLNKCLYVAFNAALRSTDRENLKPWFLFLKLFISALSRLPSIPRQTVFRGIKLDLHEHYKKGKTVSWWGFSSCTSSRKLLDTKQVLGETGPRTIFAIECISGKDIRKHCYYQSEDDILLPAATVFKVVGCFDHGSGLHVIQLEETQPPFPFLQMFPRIFLEKKTIACKLFMTTIFKYSASLH